MESPQQLNAVTPRHPDDIAATAHAIQANVVTLRVAWRRRTGWDIKDQPILTPSPGPVRRMRHLLLDRETIRSYGPWEILLRLRQIWGEFCLLCWMFPDVDPQHPINFRELPPNQPIRCPVHILSKLDEIQKHLWRILHEQRRRCDRQARKDPEFQRDDEVALMYSIRIYGRDILFCEDAPLLSAACEYAGMLAALRWASDNRWSWEGPGIMEVAIRAENILESS